MELALSVASSVGAAWCAALLLVITLHLVAPASRRVIRPVVRVLALGFWPAWIVVNIRLLWLITVLPRDDDSHGIAFLAVALFFVIWGIFAVTWIKWLGSATRQMSGAGDTAGSADR